LCLCVAAAHAADPSLDDDVINPDRPNIANSSQVVGTGRIQLEAGLQWEHDTKALTRTLSTPALLRIGVHEAVELRIETDGRTIVHAVDPASGRTAATAGYADTAFGFKWHLADQDGARPAVGIIGEVTLPTGSAAVRGSGARPVLNLPLEWDLPQGWSLAVMPGAGRDSDDNRARYGYGVLAASLGRAFTERLHGFAEVAAPRIAGAAHGGTQLVADAGLTWLVNKDCQLDAMVMHGLNDRTPNLTLAFGISVRR
jgi:hypothetical protein